MSQVVRAIQVIVVNLHDDGSVVTGHPIRDTWDGRLSVGGTVVIVAECQKNGFKTVEGRITEIMPDAVYMQNVPRLYHVNAVNDKTGYSCTVTRFPVTHKEAMNMKHALGVHNDRHIALIEVY